LIKIDPNKINIFRQVYLSEGDRLVEMMCGIIMVLAMIGYLRLAILQEGDDFQRTMILIPLGAIAAWGMIDGIMYVLLSLSQRGRTYKLFSAIRSIREQKDAHALIEDELSSTFVSSLKKENRKKLYEEILKIVNESPIVKPQWIIKRDLYVITFTFLIVFFTGFALLIPFFIFEDPLIASRVSQAIGIALLFFIGYSWGKYASRSKIKSAIGIVLLGITIVAFTIMLGG
jgi:VIT1/CCC1 family predicted Fe2+/Mn2+ transporter